MIKLYYTAAIVVLLSLVLYHFQDMLFIRRGVWFLKGLNEYTKSGYEKAAKNFKADDMKVDCTGKSYLITGSNSGIGKSVALEIAQRGGTIHMLCRNATSAHEVCQHIKDTTGNQNVHVHILDMSKPKEVVEFLRNFNQSIDVLVNNAGCMVNSRQVDEDGLETNFATNVLSTYLLTIGLANTIEKAEDGRIITVTSGGMLTQKLDVNDLQNSRLDPFDGRTVYSRNKRAQVIFTERLAQIYPKIHFSTMHPGWADTPAVRTSMPDFYEKMKDKLRTAEQGADTAVWLAISPAVKNFKSGLFFQDRVAVATNLPLACTQSSKQDEDSLMSQLEDFKIKYHQSKCD